MENGKGSGKAGNIILTTGDAPVKANNIQHDDRVSICIDDQKPPFSFVTIHGTAISLSLSIQLQLMSQ